MRTVPTHQDATLDPASGLPPVGVGLARPKPAPRPPSPVPRVSLTQEEACDALGCSEEFFVEHVRPHLAIVRGGRKRLYGVRELERFMDDHGQRWEEVGRGR